MAEETASPIFQIQRIYLKDMSLEQPNSPAIFLESEQTEIDVSIDVGAAQLADGIYESTVTVTITGKIGEKIAFLAEGKQAGIFEARNIPEEQIEPLLGIGCPNIIYPYLRANLADLITRAGFPPVHLAEINFELFFQQRVEALIAQQEQEQEAQEGKAPAAPQTLSTAPSSAPKPAAGAGLKKPNGSGFKPS